MSSNAAARKTMHDTFVEQINEVLDDIDTVTDFRVEDVDSDPDLVDIIIRGRLKSDLGKKKRGKKSKDDPISDYDRAMKGMT